MKKALLITSIALSLFSLNSVAQTAAPAGAQATASAAKDMTEAEVRKVDKEAKKVTLKHGQIKNLDMPPMTMVFQVRDDKLFDKLVSGEKIKFAAEQLQGAFVVTAVEREAAK
jgi:Cu(I)/Ag(I) efflux system periplasmic protein CusF